MKKTMIVDIISCLYICLFLYTGLFKITALEDFRATLNYSPLLRNYAYIIATTVPILELLIAIALLLPFFMNLSLLRKWGLSAGTALMAVFTIYVGYMLKFSHGPLPCSCGGIIKQLNWHQHLYFNTLFTLMGLLAIWLNRKGTESGDRDFTFAKTGIL